MLENRFVYELPGTIRYVIIYGLIKKMRCSRKKSRIRINVRNKTMGMEKWKKERQIKWRSKKCEIEKMN